MKYLVDTNAWIGFFQGVEDFGKDARKIMSDHPAECVISLASIWEVSIKISIGKLRLPYDIRTDLPRLYEQNGFELLPITFADTTAVVDLPRYHGDPFDRLMAAQALARNLQVVSRDTIFERHGLRRVW